MAASNKFATTPLVSGPCTQAYLAGCFQCSCRKVWVATASKIRPWARARGDLRGYGEYDHTVIVVDSTAETPREEVLLSEFLHWHHNHHHPAQAVSHTNVWSERTLGYRGLRDRRPECPQHSGRTEGAAPSFPLSFYPCLRGAHLHGRCETSIVRSIHIATSSQNWMIFCTTTAMMIQGCFASLV